MAVDGGARRREKQLFLRTWLKEPLKVAALGPSSPALSRAVARAAAAGPDGAVIELGAGTGPVTQALMDGGVAPDRLILFEADPGFAAMLAERFPAARVIGGDAYRAADLIAGVDAAAIVSGLPLIHLPVAPRVAFVVDCLRRCARPGAYFVQFTYTLTSPVPLDAAPELEGRCTEQVWANLPPARVWAYRLRG